MFSQQKKHDNGQEWHQGQEAENLYLSCVQDTRDQELEVGYSLLLIMLLSLTFVSSFTVHFLGAIHSLHSFSLSALPFVFLSAPVQTKGRGISNNYTSASSIKAVVFLKPPTKETSPLLFKSVSLKLLEHVQKQNKTTTEKNPNPKTDYLQNITLISHGLSPSCQYILCSTLKHVELGSKIAIILRATVLKTPARLFCYALIAAFNSSLVLNFKIPTFFNNRKQINKTTTATKMGRFFTRMSQFQCQFPYQLICVGVIKMS